MTKARDLANSAAAFAAVSATELGYVDGVTSAIQTQMDAKAPSSTAVTLTGTQTLTNKTLTSPALTTPTISTATTNGDILYGTGSGALSRLGIGSTNQALGVTGGVPAYQASSKSTLTTTGDIIYASAANTPARLGIGTASQVLAVNSGATAPEWVTPASGSLTLLSTTTVTSATTTISSISGAYKFLKIYIYNLGTSNANPGLSVTFNASNLFQGWRIGANNVLFQSAALNDSALSGAFSYGGASGASKQFGVITIDDYANTTHYKPITFNETYLTSDPADNSYYYAGKLKTTSAITSMTVTWGGTTGMTGTIKIFGGN